MKIQSATIDMLPQLMELGPVIFANHVHEIGPLDMNAWVAEIWRCVNHADRRLFVATDGGIVGIHLIALSPCLFSRPKPARTLAAWVHESRRGAGIGSDLQRAAEAWAKSAGCDMLIAAVPVSHAGHAAIGDRDASHDASVAFYESRGYAKAETVLYKEVM